MNITSTFAVSAPPVTDGLWRLKLEALCRATAELNAQLQTLSVPLPEQVIQGINLFDEVRRFETELITSALRCTNGHQKRAARLLGLKPTTLNAKMKVYGLALRATD